MIGNLNIDSSGHLLMGRVDTCEMAKKYGTPLYLMDEDLIRKNIRMYKNAIEKHYDNNGLILYASKAFSCLYMYKIAMEEGIGVDVVSGGEIYSALKAGFAPNKIYFHGNNKLLEELNMAIENNIGRIVVDNLEELNTLDKIARNNGKIVDIDIRIKPGIDAHTHDAILTGQIDSKFGFALETGEGLEAVKKSLEYSNLNLVGLHCHIGSQIFELSPFEEAAKTMLKFIKKIKCDLNWEIEELNLGGGFGIKYTDLDTPIAYDQYIKSVSEVVNIISNELSIKKPKIIMEPGRSIVGESGITLYTVGAIKEIPNIRTYVSIDGGMNDNPRYALYQADYEILVANKANQPKNKKITLAGKCCESGDLIGKDMLISDVNVGDYIAVLSTGAYNYSMSNNYNRNLKPPVVMIKDNIDKLILKRETYQDIIRNDLV